MPPRRRGTFRTFANFVYEYGVDQAFGPMAVGAMVALAAIIAGIMMGSARVLDAGFWIGTVVATWAVAALLFALVFRRWIDA